MLRFANVLALLAGLALAQEGSNQRNSGETPSLWLQDFAAAKAKAQTENKDLLVAFTGSDWSSYSQALEKTVFASEEFKSSAPDMFVLVKLDYPGDPSHVTAEIRVQNEKLRAQYPIQNFPSIALMTPAGHVYAQTCSRQELEGLSAKHLAELQKKGDAFKAALLQLEGKHGAERAKVLDTMVQSLEEQTADIYHFDLMKEIATLDEDGKAGLREKYRAKVERHEKEQLTNDAATELGHLVREHVKSGACEQAIALLDATLKQPKSKTHQQMAMFFKGMIVMNSSGNAKLALELLAKAKAIDSNSMTAQQIDLIVPQIEKQLGAGDGK